MLMGLSDVLALARTNEEREQIRETFLRLGEMKDEDIDYSDIPPTTDFSRFKPLKPYVEKVLEHNRKAVLHRKTSSVI